MKLVYFSEDTLVHLRLQPLCLLQRGGMSRARARVITREKTRYSSYFGTKQADGQEVVCSYSTLFGATLVATGRVLYILPPLEKILTPFWKIRTPFEKILPPFGKILPPFGKILTLFGEILPSSGETPSPSGPVATIVAPKRVL